MTRIAKLIFLALVTLLISNGTGAQESTAGEPLKGLDDQVQEVKSDALRIAAELSQMEQQLLYPTHTQIAVFVSLPEGETFRLDSIDLTLDNKEVAHHLYTAKERDALGKGGVQRLYTGNITTGDHPLSVTFRGKSAGDSNIKKTGKFTVKKGPDAGIVEIVLTERSVSFKDQ